MQEKPLKTEDRSRIGPEINPIKLMERLNICSCFVDHNVRRVTLPPGKLVEFGKRVGKLVPPGARAIFFAGWWWQEE